MVFFLYEFKNNVNTIIGDTMDIKEALSIIPRCLVSIVTLLIATKILGKKQVSQLSLFDYVIGISIGNFAAEATINLESDYIHGIVPVFVFGLIEIPTFIPYDFINSIVFVISVLLSK